MNNKSSHEKSTQRGQGMMEYIIIVAMIAVAAIGVYSAFGETIRVQTSGLARELAGQDSSTETSKADTTSAAAVTKSGTKGMKEYGKDNEH